MAVNASLRTELGVLLVSAVWLGLLLGVSFLATPVKFSAPSLTLPVALEIGRATFAVFNKVEWGTLVLLFILARAARISRETWSALGLGGILAVQTFWLLPILDRRLGEIIAGGVAPASYHHRAYIAVELAKLILLGFILWAGSARLLAQNSERRAG